MLVLRLLFLGLGFCAISAACGEFDELQLNTQNSMTLALWSKSSSLPPGMESIETQHGGHDHAPTVAAPVEERTGGNRAAPKYRWSSDSTFEYLNYREVNPESAFEINDSGGHLHGTIDEWFIIQRISYEISSDLGVGISQSYRNLRDVNVTDPLNLGIEQEAEGFGDLTVDVRYRFMHQGESFPVDLNVYANIKAPTGQNDEYDPFGVPFDTHDQPGSGSWDGGMGIIASRRWGQWDASGSFGFTIRGEGDREFKSGDSLRLTFSGARQVLPECWGWRLTTGLSVTGIHEFRGSDMGEVDLNHGGQFIFVKPSIDIQPIDRLTLSVSAPLPVLQEFNGTHQKQEYGLQFNIGVRF